MMRYPVWTIEYAAPKYRLIGFRAALRVNPSILKGFLTVI